MAEPLNPRYVLRLLREASDLLVGNDEPLEALRSAVDLLVPRAADRGTLFVIGTDGRLHARAMATAGSAGPGDGEGRDVEARVLEPSESEPPDEEHVASVACREGVLTFVAADAPAPRLYDGDGAPPSDDTRIRAVALPLIRVEETVGVLLVEREGDDRWYGPGDLDSLQALGERVSLALEVVWLRREVSTARRAKADFLSVMSHELRTPLTAVVGYADLLEAGISGPVTDRQVTQLKRIKESAWELLDLIDGILGFARFEGEQPDVRVEPVAPRKLVEDAMGMVRSSLMEKGLDVSIELGDDVPTLRTDPDKATRILFHVLSNAAKFTDRGEVAVEVDHDRDWVHIRIRDTGPGIGEKEQSRIFEPFWQGERPVTRTKGGTGLGLSLTRRLAELLAAEVSVESRVGVGATFTVSFPRKGPHPVFP